MREYQELKQQNKLSEANTKIRAYNQNIMSNNMVSDSFKCQMNDFMDVEALKDDKVFLQRE